MGDSDSDDENVIRYGTPLEPYEEDELPTKRKYQQPADQYAVDAHGRRRFHGAFTGGFSAGFGNTVGSQEGWTPSTFKSSRSEKAQSASQRPEDFMDEEDRSEFGIAPKHMQTQSEFSGQKRSRRTYHDGPIPGEPVLDQVIKAVHETAAVRMLKAMGWRPGQGTGDRVTRDQKRQAKEQQKVYGCYMPEELRNNTQKDEESDQDSTESEVEYDTLFAPDDYEPYLLSRKSDRFGLGYKGLSRHSVLGNMTGEYGEGSSRSHLVMKEKGKKVSIRGQAFGVGAFEADDEDIYGTEDMSHYDFTIGGPPPDRQKKATQQDRNVLPGFTPSSKPLPPVPSHPPPALPRDYTPSRTGGRKTRFDTTTVKPRDQGLGRHELTAEARGVLLGEPPRPQTTATKEDLLAKITGRNVDFVSKTQNLDDLPPNPSNATENANNKIDTQSNSIERSKIIDLTAPISNTPDFISIKDSGNENFNTFRPFMSDPIKQARYESFVKNKGVLEDDGAMDRLSEWEREREMVEFEQAAKLYRPLSGIMGDRFTHASAPDDATNPLAAVAKTSGSSTASAQQVEAARRGVYGVMTRSTAGWRPDRLVYKRFNIPDPGGVGAEPQKEDKSKVAYSIFSYLEESVHDKNSFAKEQTKFSGSKSQIDNPKIIQKHQTDTVKITDNEKTVQQADKPTNAPADTFPKRMTAAELFLKESEKTKQQAEDVTKTIDKFDKMDLYKSIFLSDSEEENEITNSNDKLVIIDDFMEIPKNVERNTSPPRGIFANIDFDEINSWRRNVDDKRTDTDKTKEAELKSSDSKTVVKQNDDKMEVEEIYGPKIPDNIQKRLEANDSKEPSNSKKSNDSNKDNVEVIDSSSEDSWVDAKEVKDKKKKKKSKHKKQKSKHKKSKYKKKDR